MHTLQKLLHSQGIDIDHNTIRSEVLEWEKKARAAFSKHGLSESSELRFGGKVPLHLLPSDVAGDLMRDYRRIIHFDQIVETLGGLPGPGYSQQLAEGLGITDRRINEGITGFWSKIRADKDILDRNPYGRFVTNPNAGFLERLYGAFNVQMPEYTSYAKTGIDKSFNVLPGRISIGSIPWVENLERDFTPAELTGKKMLVFDTESAGFRAGSIREIAYRSMTYGGDVADTVESQILMAPPQMRRGMMPVRGGAKRLNEAVDQILGIESPIQTTGDDFLQRIDPFLRSIREADYIVGHNIEGFDFDRLHKSIAGTSKYKMNDAFRAEIDTLFDSVKTRTIDTATLARRAPNLSNIKVDAGLIDGRAFSISNLLLQTDMIEKIGLNDLAQMMGYDPKSGRFVGGLHAGDVDAAVTQYLMPGRVEGLSVRTKDSYKAYKASLSAEELKLFEGIERTIRSSAALTPFTKTIQGSSTEARVRKLIGDNAMISPIEYEVLRERNLILGTSRTAVEAAQKGISSNSLLDVVGRFERMVGIKDGDYTSAYTRLGRPSSSDFLGFQRMLGNKGVAGAGLSYEERLFGSALSHYTRDVSKIDKPFAKHATDSLVSRFNMYGLDDIQFLTGSDKVTMPTQILKKAGILGGSDPVMVGLSHVRGTKAAPLGSVNLTYDLADGQADMLIGALIDIQKGGIEAFAEVMGKDASDPGIIKAFKSFEKAMEGGSLTTAVSKSKFGLTIGQVSDQSAADKVIELIKTAQNTDDISDRSKEALKYRMLLMDTDVDNGIIRTFGSFVDVGIDEEARTRMGRLLDMARNTYMPREILDGDGVVTGVSRSAGWSGIGNSPTRSKAASLLREARTQEVADKHLARLDYINQHLGPKAKKFGVAALAAGIGAIVWSKHRKNELYNEPFEFQGYDTGPGRYAAADILQQQIESGYNGGLRRMDPLATASLTENLYYNRTGSTNMSWNKSNSLYGGNLI